MITVYHGLKTRSARVIWLLEELGNVDYRVNVEGFKVPEPGIFAQNTPTGKFPTMTDGDITIYESGAINQYLLDRYGAGRLMPDRASAEWPLYLQFCTAAEASIATPLNIIGWYKFMEADAPGVDGILARMTAWANSALTSLSGELGTQDFLLPSGFSNADIMMGYTLNMARNFGAGLEGFENLDAYLNRLWERPAFQTGMGDQF